MKRNAVDGPRLEQARARRALGDGAGAGGRPL